MAARGARASIPLRELRFQYARSSGPGGQNVNKVESKAILRWDVAGSAAIPEDVRRRFLARYARRIVAGGELVLSSQRFRDRGRNVADCLEKLHVMLEAVAEPPRPRHATRPTRSSRERRLEAKRHRARVKSGRRARDDE